ncbi:MAG: YfhO family protein [Nitrospinae bacterium]|nr:YfhO family protein [Nitrospinota bacterium]MBL7019798.1 YfhO family protein [Nitrospinaceae bacterium]
MVFFIPPRQFWVEEVKNFVFPLWNPYYFSGHPLFATLQPGVLYPSSVLFLFLPFNWAFNLNIELHFALSGIFTYLLVRGMSGSQGAAFISAVAFMLSGYLISVHNLLSTLLSVTWVPLFFLCYFSAIKNNRPGHAILSGLVGTVMFLGGGIEVCYLTFGVAFFLTLVPELVLPEETPSGLKRRLFLFSTFCLIFFGLSAVQLIPFIELSHLSIRSGGLSYHEAGTWSLHPYDLLELFLPDQYGLATDIKKYWNFQNWLKTIYMGGIPFILAAIFLRKWDRRVQGFLLLFFISVGLAMGKNTLFHHFLYDNLPFFDKLRFPVKFIFLAVLIISVMAGLGYDYFKKEFTNNDSKSQRLANYILALAFLCMVVFGPLNFFNESLVTHLKAIGWDHPEYNETEINLFNFKRFLAFTGLFCLALFLYSKPRFKKPYVLVAMITLLVLDLFFAGFNFYKKKDFKEIQKMSESARFIQPDPELFRIFVTPKTRKDKFLNKIDWKGLDILKESFATGLLGNQRHFDIDGIGVTKQERWKKVIDLVKSAPAIDSTNLPNMMNVKYIVSTPPITSPDFILSYANMPIPQDLQKRKEFEKSRVLKIYKNKKFLPRAFLVQWCKVMTSEKEYKETLQSKSFNPEQILLLEMLPTGFPCDKERVHEKPEPVKIDSYKSNTVDLTVNSKSRQFLFLSDSFYPGWKAYVDGEETEILRANYMFRAIVIEPGEHKVRFDYDPLSFKLGMAISITTILLCGVYYLVTSRRRALNKRAADHYSGI